MDIKGFKSKDGTVHQYDYNALANKPEAPGSGGNVDLTGVVKSVNGQTPDENGNVEIDASRPTDEQVNTAVNAFLEENPVSSGIGSKASALLITILRNGVYNTNQSANITALENALKSSSGGSSGGSGGTETPDEPDVPENPEVTLSSISVVYSGGDVPVGTSVYALTGIVVTAHYSDGSTATVTGYTLSGTIAEGSNTVTVSYGGKTTTFTVTGVAESGGGDSGDTALYGLHHDAGYNGTLSTGLITEPGADVGVTKIVLDFDVPSVTVTGSYAKLVTYGYTNVLSIKQNTSEWYSASNVASADKTAQAVVGAGRTTVTVTIEGIGEKNQSEWKLLWSAAECTEITWYGVKFYAGDTLLRDLKPTANVGDMYDSVSGETYTFSVTDGLTLVEV